MKHILKFRDFLPTRHEAAQGKDKWRLAGTTRYLAVAKGGIVHQRRGWIPSRLPEWLLSIKYSVIRSCFLGFFSEYFIFTLVEKQFFSCFFYKTMYIRIFRT